MKNERLLNAIGEIDDNLISGAANDTGGRKKSRWLKWAAAAAGLALLVYAGSRLILEGAPGDAPELPMLTIAENTNDGMGYEGYMAYGISDLIIANPWNETAKLSELPVYQNPLVYNDDRSFVVAGADFEAMEAFLLEIAARFGMDTDQLEVTDNTPSEEEMAYIAAKVGDDIPEGYFHPTKVIAEENGIKIEVNTSMTAYITFEPAISLPDGYRFQHHASYEDTLAAAEYLQETYRDVLGMDNPKLCIYGGDYNIYLQQRYQIGFYDTGRDMTEDIINYHFRRVEFYCDDDGKLMSIRIYHPGWSETTGDYPIISVDEASRLLLNGNYTTSVPYEVPGQEYIAGVELVYRTGAREEYFMPYYRFYVELPEDEREGGLKTYGAYYVPAVEQAYISNMPVWDGNFN